MTYYREHELALWVGGHIRPIAESGSVMRVEWPQHGALSAGWWLGVVDVVDQKGEAEDVGKEDEFLQMTE